MFLDAGADPSVYVSGENDILTYAIIREHRAITYMLIDYGASLSRLKFVESATNTKILTEAQKSIYGYYMPEWLEKFLVRRDACRKRIKTLIGLHKHRLTSVTKGQDANIIKLIAKHVWSMRTEENNRK